MSRHCKRSQVNRINKPGPADPTTMAERIGHHKTALNCRKACSSESPSVPRHNRIPITPGATFAADSGGELPKTRVLAAVDDAALVRATRRLIKSAGFTVEDLRFWRGRSGAEAAPHPASYSRRRRSFMMH
jgi:hypothetical protein